MKSAKIFCSLIFLTSFSAQSLATTSLSAATSTVATFADVWDFNRLSGNWVSAAPPQVLQAQQVLFVVHASPAWDGSLSTKMEVQKMVQSTLLSNSAAMAHHRLLTPVLLFVDDVKNLANYFWSAKNGIQLVASIGGQHSIHLQDTRTAFVAGGVFEYCMCRTVRDLILNNDFSLTKSLEVAFVEDSIYINDRYSDPRWSGGLVGTMPLSVLTRTMTDTQLFAYIVSRYFGDQDTGFCTQLNDTVFPGSSIPNQFTFEIRRQGRWIGRIGNRSGTLVQLNFISLDDYFARLSL
jgi:hypothetical protein